MRFSMRLLVRQFRFRRILLPISILLFVSTFLWLSRPSDTVTDSHSDANSVIIVPPEKPLQPPKESEQEVEKPKPFENPPPPPIHNQVRAPSVPKRLPLTIQEIQGNEPKNATVAAIRNQIREMMSHAWKAYAKYAWGANELKPNSKEPHQPDVLGSSPLGASIIDGMDTLYIMGLMDEFRAARKFVAEELHFDKHGHVSVFEFTIRFLGGMLSAYTFTSDKIFLDKSVELAQRLLPAFNTQTGIPMSLIDLKNGACRMFSWSRGQCSILAEAGTLHMEFTYLSELTGDPIYAQKVDVIRRVISSLPRPKGMFYNFLGYKTRRWCANVAGLSGLADSFYEYLLKEWIRTDHTDTQARNLYDAGIQALLENEVFKQSIHGHLYITAYNDGSSSHVMDHLACFAGGMLTLGASNKQDEWFKRGVEITRTCNFSYYSTMTKLGPEGFEFSQSVEAQAVKSAHKSYMLRPETIESYFYLWRFTKDEAYRIAALDVVHALEKYCRTPSGYSGLINVQSSTPLHDNVQQSYFLAETLKYLYLIFSEDSQLPLDRWVFNTEAHPFPVHNRVDLGTQIDWPKVY